MKLTIANAHLHYEDIINVPIVHNNQCDCINNNYLPDNDGYYMVCNICGECADFVNKVVINYDEIKYLKFCKKRYYKKSSYLKLKINNIFHNKLPPLIEQHISILKKKQNINITSLIKYMKKKKLIKKYDPLKSLYIIKEIEPIQLTELFLIRLVNDFNKKEIIYRENNYPRFNYNFIIMKIFQEWNNDNLYKCFKSLQDDNIMNKHENVYNQLFN